MKGQEKVSGQITLRDPERIADVFAETTTGSTDETGRLNELILNAAVLWHQKNGEKSGHNDSITHEKLAEGLTDRAELILRHLERIGPTTPATLADACGIPLSSLQRNLRSLWTSGVITKTGNTRGVRYALPKTQK